jgi:hypothetical protein
MKLTDTRNYYTVSSGKVSEIVRQLGLAGIAVVWIFRRDVSGEVRVSRILVTAALLIVLGLVCDLLQYAVATRAWDRFNLRKERELLGRADREERDFPAPDDINDCPKFLFWLKFWLICGGYLAIIVFLVRTVSFT